MTFGVAQCGCGQAWAVELRHAQAACPRCRRAVALEPARLRWSGGSAAEARAVVATLGGAVPEALTRPRLPRHDSPVEAAAAQGAGIANKSSRAELVALALSRLCGVAARDDLLEALEKAGLERKRAEAELVRMLAMDVLLEPRAGFYRMVDI
ncbi:MAG: hypothetical protein QOD77_954 [Thermoplasmata archaeon]|nr:hypothetical protein [Thermoplasmata archaeon]